MKPSAIIRKRIEDHFLKPSADGDSTVPTEAWIGEILKFLDQEAERQKVITDELSDKVAAARTETYTLWQLVNKIKSFCKELVEWTP